MQITYPFHQTDLSSLFYYLSTLFIFIFYYFCESIILSCEFTLSKGKKFKETLRLQPWQYRCTCLFHFTLGSLSIDDERDDENELHHERTGRERRSRRVNPKAKHPCSCCRRQVSHKKKGNPNEVFKMSCHGLPKTIHSALPVLICSCFFSLLFFCASKVFFAGQLLLVSYLSESLV